MFINHPFRTVPLVFLLIFSLFACTPQKESTLFQTIPYNSEVKTLVTKDFEHKVRPDDILTIVITSPSEEVKNYNTLTEYLVDKNGQVQLYRLGNVKVEGLTLSQVKEKITQLLVPDYFKQASVAARFKNHKVILMGEVGAPGVINLETEHISILEAISTRGDLKETAKKDNILVIRNTPNGKMFYRINLLDGSVFNSPYYYLQAEDVVYVEPDPEQKKKGANTQQIVSYVISGLSLLFLIFDRVYY
jgi:polysaccharide biosynthesis/export protein